MTDAKPSPGPWRSRTYRMCVQVVDDHGEIVTNIGVALYKGGCFNTKKANAELIAEAGTVYHETGCTPRQLLQQRDEALKALVYIKLMKDIKNPQYTPELELEAWENADTVMRKHESIEEDGR